MGHYKKLKYLVTGFHEIAVLNILQISWIIVWWSVSLVPVGICCLGICCNFPEEVLHHGCFTQECYKTF